MSDYFEVFGVPADLANAPGVVTPASSREPAQNPNATGGPSVFMTNAQAHAALKALAVEDGWWALYDPTNSASLTKDASGNVTAIADTLGNGPTLTVYSGNPAVPTQPMGSLQALKALYGASLVSNGFFVMMAATDSTLFYLSPPSAPSLSKPYFYSSLGSVGAGASDADTQRVIPYAAGGTPSEPKPPLVMSFDSRSNDVWLGEHLAPYDTDPTNADISTPTGILYGDSGVGVGGGGVGPLVLAQNQPGEDARLRMTRLLTQLSGAMTTIGDVGGLSFDSYATVDESGKLVAGFRPWKPVQTASVIKALMAYVARKFVTDAMLNTSVAVVDPYQPTDNRFPAVYTGDTLTWRSLFTITNHVSHNRLSSTIAYHAEKLRNPTGTGTTEQIIGRFLTHVKSVCTGFGWTEAVIGTPNGYRDCILSPYHVALLFQKIRAEDPWLTTMMGTPNASFTINHIARSGEAAWTENGTVTNIVTKDMGGRQYPELTMGKGGTLANPSLATLATVWRDPATGKSMGTMFSSGPGGSADDRHLGTRRIYDAVRSRYNGPEHWEVPGEGSTLLWGKAATDTYAVLAKDPNNSVWEPEPAITPFDSSVDALPIVRKGDSINFRVRISMPWSAGVGAKIRVSSKIIGGTFTNGSDTVYVDVVASSALAFTNWAVTGTVSRGGLLVVSAAFLNADDDATMWATSAVLTINSPQSTTNVYRMPLSGYTATVESMPLDLSNMSGSVGDFTAQVNRPELKSIISQFGHRYLYGKNCRLTTSRGVFHGTIVDADLRNRAQISIIGTLGLGPLNAYNVRAKPYSGPLSGLIQTYIGLVAESAPNVSIDPSIGVINVSYPGWFGDLWPMMKYLCAAHSIQITAQPDGSIHFGPALSDAAAPGHVSGYMETGNPQTLARAVEVVKYSYDVVTNSLVYPPGGWSENVEVITIAPGDVLTYELQLDTSITGFEQPIHVDYVSESHNSSSVYSIVDETGRTVTKAEWESAGGIVRFDIGPDSQSVMMRITAPRRLLLDNFGKTVQSYTFGSRFGDASTQYSTIRIIGSGVSISSETLRIPTGVDRSLTGSDVGITIDNPFICNMAQAGAAGMRAALTFSGHKAEITADMQVAPVAGALIKGDRMNYRHRSSTITPDGVSISAEYALLNAEHQAGFAGMTNAEVEAWYAGLTFAEAQNRGKRVT